MAETFIGSITSNQLSVLGNKHYGFIGIETDDSRHVKVKVAAFTVYETLEIGERVQIVAEPLGNTWTAKTITRS